MTRKPHPAGPWLFAALAASLLATGCATKKYVRGEVGTSLDELESRLSGRIDGVETQAEQSQTQLTEQGSRLAQVSQTAQEALERAVAAGKLAEGKLLFETVLADDKVRFGFEQAALTPEARTALDEFAQQLRAENKNVYIEIQGHTDATGPEPYNFELGEERAEAVRRYLNQEHQIPLHRMSVISYGESAPVAGNATREERSQNRRVSLVVLM